jgi:hypothetical protein
MGHTGRGQQPDESGAPGESLRGWGSIVSVQRTLASTGSPIDPSHVCVFTVAVSLDDDGARYVATCRQAVRASVLARLMSAGAVVTVSVDRRDHSRIELSLEDPAPILTPEIRTHHINGHHAHLTGE